MEYIVIVTNKCRALRMKQITEAAYFTFVNNDANTGVHAWDLTNAVVHLGGLEATVKLILVKKNANMGVHVLVLTGADVRLAGLERNRSAPRM